MNSEELSGAYPSCPSVMTLTPLNMHLELKKQKSKTKTTFLNTSILEQLILLHYYTFVCVYGVLNVSKMTLGGAACL